MPLLILLALMAAVPVAWSQGRQPVLLQEPLVTESASEFTFRSLEDDKGGFYLLWPRQAHGRAAIYAQHVNAEGQALWKAPGVPLVDDLPARSAWEAVPDTEGGLLLAWEKDEKIAVQRFDTEARPLWSEKFQVVTQSTSSQRSPALSPDGSGGAYVVWQQHWTADRNVVMAQHINNLGAKLWGDTAMRVSLRPSQQQRAKLVYDGTAGAIVAWQDKRESASQLQAQRLNYQGNRLWGLEGVVITAPADSRNPPFLGAVGKGSAVFAWQASSAAADRIFLQLMNAAGKAVWHRLGLEISLGGGHQWNPVLHGDGQEGVWVGWEDYRSHARWSVFVKHLHVDGRAAWPDGDIALAKVDADQGRLALTDDGLGGVLAAWVDNRAGTTGIYLQQVDEQGRPRLGAEGMTVAVGLKDPQTPKIVSLQPGHAAICWADTPSKGRWALFWQRVGTPRPARSPIDDKPPKELK